MEPSRCWGDVDVGDWLPQAGPSVDDFFTCSNRRWPHQGGFAFRPCSVSQLQSFAAHSHGRSRRTRPSKELALDLAGCWHGDSSPHQCRREHTRLLGFWGSGRKHLRTYCERAREAMQRAIHGSRTLSASTWCVPSPLTCCLPVSDGASACAACGMSWESEDSKINLASQARAYWGSACNPQGAEFFFYRSREVVWGLGCSVQGAGSWVVPSTACFGQAVTRKKITWMCRC